MKPSCRAATVLSLVAACVVLVAGCGGDDASAPPATTAARQATPAQRQAVARFSEAAASVCAGGPEPRPFAAAALVALDASPDAVLGASGRTIADVMRDAEESIRPCRRVLADEVLVSLP